MMWFVLVSWMSVFAETTEDKVVMTGDELRVKNYNNLMQKLDTLEETVVKEFSTEKKSILNDYKKFQEGMKKQYPYMALNCLGVMNLDYVFSGAKVESWIFSDLISLNSDIYRYKLGLEKKSSSISDKMDIFEKKESSKQIKKLTEEYTQYKKDFLVNLNEYIKKNQELMLPLIDKMQKIDVMKKEQSQLMNSFAMVKKKIAKDELLGKMLKLQSPLEKILSTRFDSVVASSLNSSTLNKIKKLKEEYLASYNKDFLALFSDLLWEDFHPLNTESFDTITKKYFSENNYACSILVNPNNGFKQYQNTFSLEKKENTKYLLALTKKVDTYLVDTSVKKKKKQTQLILNLKDLIQSYTDAKLRKIKLAL